MGAALLGAAALLLLFWALISATSAPVDRPGGKIDGFHPWAAPIAAGVIVCTGVLLCGLVLNSLDVDAGG
jgi:hypothetical protein